ncbi:MAG: YraN family protein [Thermodesulforhabdaceae bacterium]
MNEDRRETGQKAENVAEAFLESKGIKVIDRNVSCRWGEIDIVARDGKYVVFVEVRSASEGFLVHPFESVTKKKQLSIIKAASWYLKRNRMANASVRFDVVGIIWRKEREPELKWIKNAFDASKSRS